MGPMGQNQARHYVYKKFAQVAVPVGDRDNYSVWLSSSECGTGIADFTIYN